MSNSLRALVKLVFVGGVMWFVFRSVTFEDRMVTRSPDGEQVLEEVPGEIIGPWNDDVVRFRPEDSEQVVLLERGRRRPDDTQVEVVPGLRTYGHALDPLLFSLGAFCYYLTVLIAGSRWWWLLRVNGTDVSLGETLRFTWIGVFFNSVVPAGATGGDLITAGLGWWLRERGGELRRGEETVVIDGERERAQGSAIVKRRPP